MYIAKALRFQGHANCLQRSSMVLVYFLISSIQLLSLRFAGHVLLLLHATMSIHSPSCFFSVHLQNPEMC